MIRKVAIKSFKSLLDVDIELGRVNVFVGANGNGKSNLLEAIGVLSAAASGRVDDESLLRRGVRPGVPALCKSSFKIDWAESYGSRPVSKNIPLSPSVASARRGLYFRDQYMADKRSSKQVFLTSHNPLVLDGLPLDNDDVRLFVVDRSRKGRTTINRIRVTLADLQRDGELWTVSRLWIMGHLGGAPNV